MMEGQNSLTLVVAPAAQSDIADIFSYTLDRWGENQAQKYLMSIKKALQTLREQPLKGNVRTDLNPSIRSIIIEKTHCETFARDRCERKMRKNMPDCGGKRRE